jgi:hypothetical protein
MNSYLAAKKSSFCVANLHDGTPIARDWRLESDFFRSQSAKPGINQKIPSQCRCSRGKSGTAYRVGK